jgi:hypothetical protein
MSTTILEVAAEPRGSSVSGVSWGAIIAGAIAASVMTFVLLILGSGLGLTMVSPWTGAGAAASTFAISTAIWMIIVQWLSSGLGGYLTGRLRTRWTRVHDDEVFFRDTAHGFVAWALATLLVVGILGSAVTSVIKGGASAVASVAQGATAAAGNQASDPTGYLIDVMFRPTGNTPASQVSAEEARTETSRIFLRSAAEGQMSAPDKAYLAQLISARTGISESEAQKRINDALAQAKSAADQAKAKADAARKAGAVAALMTTLSLLIGAFIAAVAAALGGSHRDENEGLAAIR